MPADKVGCVTRTTRFDAAGVILLACENAFRAAGEAVQALGGAGYTKDWPVERYLRDAKLLDIGAGKRDEQQASCTYRGVRRKHEDRNTQPISLRTSSRIVKLPAMPLGAAARL